MEIPASEPQLEREKKIEALFSAHYQALTAYALRRFPGSLVDDIVAETFLVAWRRVDRVPANPRPWLIAVARNVGATRLRGERRRLSLLRRLAGRLPNIYAPDLDTDRCDPVIEALARLPERDREAITLMAWDELTPTEAAEALGQSAVSFRVRLHRARKRLRQELAQSSYETLAGRRISAEHTESGTS